MLLSILRLHENLITPHRDESRLDFTTLSIREGAVGLERGCDQRADEREEDKAKQHGIHCVTVFRRSLRDLEKEVAGRKDDLWSLHYLGETRS